MISVYLLLDFFVTQIYSLLFCHADDADLSWGFHHQPSVSSAWP